MNPDMHDWWSPTAAGYFDHVSKAMALEAVQVFAPTEVNRLAKLKKARLVAEAERLAAGSGWLPLMFQTFEASQPLTKKIIETEVDSQAVPTVAEFEDTDAAA